MKRRCEINPTHEKVNPGKNSGCSVLTEWLKKEGVSWCDVEDQREGTHLKATKIW